MNQPLLARLASAALLISLLLTGCAAATPTALPTPAPTGALTPYRTATLTPSATPLPTGYVTAAPSPTATITPTPVTYTVRRSDDMFGIAFSFGVSPAALMTANPTVNPRAMSVGQVLVIPITPGAEEAAATPTPAPPTPTPLAVAASPVTCWRGVQQGYTCFLLATNDEEAGLENLSGVIRLEGEGLAEPLEGAAISPLNLLPPGRSMPLAAVFPGPLPEGLTAAGRITLALPQPADDVRYTPALMEDDPQVTVAEDGLSARVTGAIALEGSRPAVQVWVLLTAFDAQGRVAGMRKWEAVGGLTPGDSLPFEAAVYSLGPEIARVEVQVEAQTGEAMPIVTITPSPVP